MEEVRRLAVACGLPDFRYYSFPPATFVQSQVLVTEILPSFAVESVSPEHVANVPLAWPTVEPVAIMSSEAKPDTAPHSVTAPTSRPYPLLVDIGTLAKGLRPATVPCPPATGRPYRRARPAARVAMAVINRF